MTNYIGHSNHFYFTDPCWFNDNYSFSFMSDRKNQSNLSNLFRYDLDNGKITQLTDFKIKGHSRACWSEANQHLYYWYENKIYGLNPDNLEESLIYELNSDMQVSGRPNATADGKYIMTSLIEEMLQDKPSISFAYSRFHEMFHRQPLT